MKNQNIIDKYTKMIVDFIGNMGIGEPTAIIVDHDEYIKLNGYIDAVYGKYYPANKVRGDKSFVFKGVLAIDSNYIIDATRDLFLKFKQHLTEEIQFLEQSITNDKITIKNQINSKPMELENFMYRTIKHKILMEIVMEMNRFENTNNLNHLFDRCIVCGEYLCNNECKRCRDNNEENTKTNP